MKGTITFKKIILLFSVVVATFVVFSLALILHNNMQNRQNTFSFIYDKVELTASTLTNVVEQLYTTTIQVSEQPNLNKLANFNYTMKPYQITSNILLLRDQQSSITNANNYIQKISIYYRLLGKVYHNDEHPSFHYVSDEEYQNLWDTQTHSNFLTHLDGNLIGIVKPPSSRNFMLKLELNPKEIASLLEETFIEYSPYYLLDCFDHSYQLTNLSEQQLADLNLNSIPIEPSAEEGLMKSPHSANNQPLNLTIDGEKYYLFSCPFPYGESRIYYFFSHNQLFDVDHPHQFINVAFGLLLFFICCFYLWETYRLIHKPINALVNAFQDINNHDYSVCIFEDDRSDFAILYKEFNRMAKQLQLLIEKDYQQQLLLNKAELKQLQAQINPHFLYNSLFLLRSMSYDGLHKEVQQLADIMGQYFQYITRNGRDYMPLGQEYNHALLYCEIQKLRFEGRVQIESDSIPQEYVDYLVPKLIIQPLLENAFNYGLHNKVENGLLKLTVSTQKDNLVITVEDNGTCLSVQKLEELQRQLGAIINSDFTSIHEVTGILNIQRRLFIYFDGRGYLQAKRSHLGGLQIQMILPLK